jgi:hypothetical protein
MRPTSARTAPDILGELGYSAAEIEAMFAKGGVKAPVAAAAKAAE